MSRYLLVVAVLAGALALPPRDARSQDVGLTDAQQVVLREAWDDLMRAQGMDPRGATVEQYRTLLRAWSDDPRVTGIFQDQAFQDRLTGQLETLEDDAVKDERLLSRSVNAAATNARSVGLLERTGLVDVLALAFEGSNLLSADDNAVTVNLNGAALFFHPATEDPRATAAARHRHRSGWSRLGGSVTFGAKLPEEEITGFSGFPDADKLFDALSWDVKVRVFGDRDPRAQKWEDRLFYLGSLNFADTFGAPRAPLAPGVAAPDTSVFDTALDREIGAATDTVLGRIKRSWQGSVKVSGQHLANAVGMDKYAAVAMVDGGLGPVDVTLNASYSATQDVSEGSEEPYTLKQWKVAAGLVGTILEDRILKGRGTVLTLSAEGLFPNDGADVPIERKSTWRADLAAKFPVSDTLSVPVSVTWTNDPNNLTKQKYATGQIGINYDFGALKSLLGK